MVNTPPFDLVSENPSPFFDPTRISRAIFDPRKNFLKTIWQRRKPVGDAELNEREDIDNFIRRQILVLLAGELTIVGGLCPEQNTENNKIYLTAGQIVVRGWHLHVEKNEGGMASVDQNFRVFVLNGSTATPYPVSGLGFNPSLNFDQPVGDSNTTIIARGTGYSVLNRTLTVELENTCNLGAVKYRVETLDGAYSETFTVQPQTSHQFVLKEDLVNKISLSTPPTAGTASRIDTIYLFVGEVEICSTVTAVKRNGHLSHPEDVPTNILDPIIGAETHRRTQVQFDLRACTGGRDSDIPTPPPGFFVYPLFHVARRPACSMIKLEDITPYAVATKLDIEKSGLFDLVVQGSGIRHDLVIDINDAGQVVPSHQSVVVGSTVHVRNIGPAMTRYLTLGDESVELEPYESFCVNFNKQGPQNLFDTNSLAILDTVTVTGWGSGGLDLPDLDTIKCAIGPDYFEGSQSFHKCDSSDNPPTLIQTEQPLDIRVESLVYDMFELAVCMAQSSSGGRTMLTYLFVDVFKDLTYLDPASANTLRTNGAYVNDGTNPPYFIVA